jgi:hypothetical protein
MLNVQRRPEKVHLPAIAKVRSTWRVEGNGPSGVDANHIRVLEKDVRSGCMLLVVIVLAIQDKGHRMITLRMSVSKL